jgi:hypothetical protein
MNGLTECDLEVAGRHLSAYDCHLGRSLLASLILGQIWSFLQASVWQGFYIIPLLSCDARRNFIYKTLSRELTFTLVGANLCAPDSLEVNGKGIKICGGGGGVADKKACTVHSTNISQRRCFVVRCLAFPTSELSLVYTVFAFVFLLLTSYVGKTRRFTSTTIPSLNWFWAKRNQIS